MLFNLCLLQEHRAQSHFAENCLENDSVGSDEAAKQQESVMDWKGGAGGCTGGTTLVLISPTSSSNHIYCSTYSHWEVTGLI